MALTVEDGSIVAGADSYVSVTDFRTFSTKRGFDFSANSDAEVEAWLIRAMDYLEAQRSSFQGVKTSQAQALQWPREGVKVDGYYIDGDLIPGALKNAQMFLAVDAKETDLQPTVAAGGQGPLVRKRIEGVIEKEWAAPTSVSSETAAAKPQFTSAMDALAELLQPVSKRLDRA